MHAKYLDNHIDYISQTDSLPSQIEYLDIHADYLDNRIDYNRQANIL